MALTQTRPESDATTGAGTPPGGRPQPQGLDAVLASGDHKTIGRLWIGFGSLFLVSALAVSALASFELLDPASLDVVNRARQVVQLWSLGNELLIFGGVAPILVGLATYLVPLQVGASSLAFARGASAAFWSWLVSTLLLIGAFLDNGGPAGGRLDGVILWTLALGGVIVSIIWALVCVATTVLGARTTGMHLDRVPVSAWGFLVFSLVGLFTLPLNLAQLVFAYLDNRGGYLLTPDDRIVLLGLDLNLTLAPTMYWLLLPVLGIALDAVAIQTRVINYYHRLALGAIGLLGIIAVTGAVVSFGGRDRVVAADNAVLVALLAVAVLPVLIVLALVAGLMRRGRVQVRTPLAAGAASMVLGVLAVAVGAVATIDPVLGFLEEITGESINRSSAIALGGTAFHEGVRGLVIGAALLGIIAGLHTWAIKIWGRVFDDRFGLLATAFTVVGSLLWGIGGVGAGLLEAPRLALEQGVSGRVEAFNLVGLIGIALLVPAAALVVLNVVAATAKRGASSEPWRGLTLEWATASPPPYANFASAPVVNSATPLAEPDFSLEASGS